MLTAYAFVFFQATDDYYKYGGKEHGGYHHQVKEKEGDDNGHHDRKTFGKRYVWKISISV